LHAKARAIGKALRELDFGIVDCPKTGEQEKPIFCTGCDNTQCLHYDSMVKMCGVFNVTPKDIWEKQKEYEQNRHKILDEGIRNG